MITTYGVGTVPHHTHNQMLLFGSIPNTPTARHQRASELLLNNTHRSRLKGADGFNALKRKMDDFSEVLTIAEAGLERSDLFGANLRMVDFPDAKMAHAFMGSTNCYQAKLPGADLTQAQTVGAKFIGTDLTGATLIELNKVHYGVHKDIRADFRGATLIDANLSGAKLTRSDFRNAKLHNATLIGANLGDANLSGAELQGATMDLFALTMILMGPNGTFGDNLKQVTLEDMPPDFWNGVTCNTQNENRMAMLYKVAKHLAEKPTPLPDPNQRLLDVILTHRPFFFANHTDSELFTHVSPRYQVNIKQMQGQIIT